MIKYPCLIGGELLFENLNFIEQVLAGFFLIVLFLVDIALVGFAIYLVYIKITNMLMLNKWLKKQLYEESPKTTETKREQG